MKRILTVLVVIVLSMFCCNAQLTAPAQTDTLVIKSMQYHFAEIHPGNWPYSVIIRNADSYVFGDQKFKIVSSENCITFKLIVLESGNAKDLLLKLYYKGPDITIHFSDYIFVCENPSANGDSSILDERSPFSGIAPNDTPLIVPSFILEDRTVDNAGLKKPSYATQESGIVVVDIWVDQYGKVQKAVPGGAGTTVKDKELWNSARKAALETGFNMNANAPALQNGTITYIFILR